MNASFAPLLEAFFLERMQAQRGVSPNTLDAYRHTFRLLLRYAQQRLGKSPSSLDLSDVDALLIGGFLTHLEVDRGNQVRSRNARLAAIHSLFKFLAYREPAHSGQIQRVLAIPHKRFERGQVTYLTRPEVEALLAAPHRDTWRGRRDHAFLLVATQTGLRVSELLALRRQDLELGSHPSVRCMGKGRKERRTPLTHQAVRILRAWLSELPPPADSLLFPGCRGVKLSRDAAAAIVSRHVARAKGSCPSLGDKRVTPHVLRHTAAMMLREAGVDCSVIALWLGHESIETTQVYLHADLATKERALARVSPAGTPWRRFRASDELMAFLEGDLFMPRIEPVDRLDSPRGTDSSE